MDARNYYVYGSAAPQVIEPEKQNHTSNKVVKRKTSARSSRRAKPIIEKEIIIAVSIAFVLCFIILYRFAIITEINYNLDKSIERYNLLKNDNLKLMAEIEKTTDLDRIQKIAEKRLGMHKPDKYQIVCISVPRSSFAEVADKGSLELNEKSFLKNFQKALANFANMILK